MLAPRDLPAEYATWNRKWGAPFGHRLRNVAAIAPSSLTDRIPVPVAARAFGPFGFMWNATTRRFEYPWTYFSIAPTNGMRVLEIGGGIAGLQFVLAKVGCEVHNVDPFLDFGSGPQTDRRLSLHGELNQALGTDVHHHRSTLPEAALQGEFDAVYSVSTLEHIPTPDLEATLTSIVPLLRSGGTLVLTVDLFLNLAPFCSGTTNRWMNVSMRWIEEVTGLRLKSGVRAELYGYEEFSSDSILVQLERFNINQGYPELVQCMVLEKP